MSHSSQIGFQDSTSPVMEELLYFHDHALMLLLLISVFILYIIIITISTNLSDKLIINSQEFELGWTILPVIILSVLAVPSIRALYILDETLTPSLTIKAVGNQWFWSYEYTDFNNLSFDSYMIPSNDISFGQYRLLEADNRMIIPTRAFIRLIVTSEDVLHSWTVPTLGVKVDAVPGRLNQISFFSQYPGVYYGQCSEICGINHSFMPIVIEAVPTSTFESWASTEMAKIED